MLAKSRQLGLEAVSACMLMIAFLLFAMPPEVSAQGEPEESCSGGSGQGYCCECVHDEELDEYTGCVKKYSGTYSLSCQTGPRGTGPGAGYCTGACTLGEM